MRSHDLDADRQALGREAVGGYGRGQVGEARIAGPKELGGCWHRVAIDLDGALVALGGPGRAGRRPRRRPGRAADRCRRRRPSRRAASGAAARSAPANPGGAWCWRGPPRADSLGSSAGSRRASSIWLVKSASAIRLDVAARRRPRNTSWTSSAVQRRPGLSGRPGSPGASGSRLAPAGGRRRSPSTSATGSVSITATLKWSSRSRGSGGSASCQQAPSISSGPAITPSATSRSTALRASGPITDMSALETAPPRLWPQGEQMPKVGLWP